MRGARKTCGLSCDGFVALTTQTGVLDPRFAGCVRKRKFSRLGTSSSVVDPVPHGQYDSDMMKRGQAARRLIREGEDPVRMLLAVVWPDHNWAESALHTRLMHCPRCSDCTVGCQECGSTGLVTTARRKLLAIEDLAAAVYEAA
jgi:hypothetical protein